MRNTMFYLKQTQNHLLNIESIWNIFFLFLQNLEDKAELFGVVVHYVWGSSSGHYFAFVKLGQHWFRIDDMKVFLYLM